MSETRAEKRASIYRHIIAILNRERDRARGRGVRALKKRAAIRVLIEWLANDPAFEWENQRRGFPMRPYYQDDLVTLYHGDSSIIAPGLGGGFAVVSDPPYGIGFDTDYRRFTVPQPDGSVGRTRTHYTPIHGDDKPFDPTPWLAYPDVILWGANCYSSRLPLGSWLVWDKRFKNGEAFLSDAEVAWQNKGHGTYIFASVSQGFLRDEPAQHPTQKPITLMEWCIRRTSAKRVVLDPFAGSGTTLVAAKNVGRKAVGIEIDERYCAITAQRLSQEVLDFGDVA